MITAEEARKLRQKLMRKSILDSLARRAELGLDRMTVNKDLMSDDLYDEISNLGYHIKKDWFWNEYIISW